jgi:hypothetical protein
MELLIILASSLVAAGRFTVPGHGFSWPGTYEAIAHIWVGFLVGVGVCARDRDTRKLAWLALAVITLVEVAAAVWLK